MEDDRKDKQAAQFDVSESTGYEGQPGDALQGSAGQGQQAANQRGSSVRQHGGATMPQGPSDAQQDPRHHTANVKQMLEELRDHLREDAAKVTELKAQALFETTAEVLQGLLNAYEHYEKKSEPAMR